MPSLSAMSSPAVMTPQADLENPAGARVRAATALMDRAVLERVEGIEWDDNSDGQHPWDQGPNSGAMKTYDDCF